MNSAYGKTILKPIQTELIVKRKDDYEKYIKLNYNFIQEAMFVGNRVYIKKIKAINNHFNYCHCGVEVLSMSKRIMNEVMVLAEDKNCKMYYQDTDSIHMNYEDVATITKEYREKYKRELIGKDMNQFHIDFEIYDEEGEKIKELKDIHSEEAYFLGKKIYCHTITAIQVHKDGLQEKRLEQQHNRMKGITPSTIDHAAKVGNKETKDVYKALYDKDTVNFDLTEAGQKCGFKFENKTDLSVRSYKSGEFHRNITLPDRVERIKVC
jgi:hypothetical protein